MRGSGADRHPTPAFETVRIAAIQATPIILDADATVDKAVDLLGKAADDGAQLAVLPETFVSVYPSGAWAAAAVRFAGFRSTTRC